MHTLNILMHPLHGGFDIEDTKVLGFRSAHEFRRVWRSKDRFSVIKVDIDCIFAGKVTSLNYWVAITSRYLS